METISPEIAGCIIDGLDGTTAVAKLLKLPKSTVHSWRRIGMSPSRADHLRLATAGTGREIDFATGKIVEQVMA